VSTGARHRELVGGFSSCEVAVLGDLMLDHYVWGDVDRISPEAPIPVVRVDHESSMLGGAGNVARNLASLGARVSLVAVVGHDAAAEDLRLRADEWKLDTAGIVPDPERVTTQKTRVIARGQQVVRYDRESEDPISEAVAERVLDQVRRLAPRVSGVVIEDYGKGLLTPELIAAALQIFAEHGVRVFVDPKNPPWHQFAGVELLKPNCREAEEACRIRVATDADMERVIERVLELSGARAVAVTRGAEGMTLLEAGTDVVHVRGTRRAVADAAGAGDTAIAVLTLARLVGGSWLEAAELANGAAGFVVGVRGTATLSAAELLAELERRR